MMIAETLPAATSETVFAGLFESVISWINGWNLLTALATIITVLSGLAVLVRFVIKNYKHILCRTVKVYKHEGYYSEAFVINNLKKTKKIVQIICVRNTRISSPDILRAFGDFVLKNDGTIELYYMDPSSTNSDDIFDRIRVTLPTPPPTADACRKEIITNENRIIDAVQNWDRAKQGKMHLFRYHGLPTIHMCRFDNRIFLGFQFFDPSEAAGLNNNTLNDYCTVIRTKSNLGQLILNQINYLQEYQTTRQAIERHQTSTTTPPSTEADVVHV